MTLSRSSINLICTLLQMELWVGSLSSIQVLTSAKEELVDLTKISRSLTINGRY
jgi:hypothetical protein